MGATTHVEPPNLGSICYRYSSPLFGYWVRGREMNPSFLAPASKPIGRGEMCSGNGGALLIKDVHMLTPHLFSYVALDQPNMSQGFRFHFPNPDLTNFIPCYLHNPNLPKCHHQGNVMTESMLLLKYCCSMKHNSNID